MRLEFTQFDVEWGRNCKNDFVRITDGDGTILMEKSCGSSSKPRSHKEYFQPQTITTRSNTVIIFFHMNGSAGTQTGWSLSWTAVTPGLKRNHPSIWIVIDLRLMRIQKGHLGSPPGHTCLNEGFWYTKLTTTKANWHNNGDFLLSPTISRVTAAVTTTWTPFSTISNLILLPFCSPSSICQIIQLQITWNM